MFDQNHFRSASNNATSRNQRFFYAVNGMSRQLFQLQQIRGHDVTAGNGITRKEFRYAWCNDTSFFWVPHHWVAEIPSIWIGSFDFAYNIQNMPALFWRTNIPTQYGIAVFKLIDVCNSLHNFCQMIGWHHTASPVTVLGMI